MVLYLAYPLKPFSNILFLHAWAIVLSLERRLKWSTCSISLKSPWKHISVIFQLQDILGRSKTMNEKFITWLARSYLDQVPVWTWFLALHWPVLALLSWLLSIHSEWSRWRNSWCSEKRCLSFIYGGSQRIFCSTRKSVAYGPFTRQVLYLLV